MCDSTAVHRSLSTGNRSSCPWSFTPCTLEGRGLWNPTSREKRARYGAPVLRYGTGREKFFLSGPTNKTGYTEAWPRDGSITQKQCTRTYLIRIYVCSHSSAITMRRASDSVCEGARLRKRLSGGARDTRWHRA